MPLFRFSNLNHPRQNLSSFSFYSARAYSAWKAHQLGATASQSQQNDVETEAINQKKNTEPNMLKKKKKEPITSRAVRERKDN